MSLTSTRKPYSRVTVRLLALAGLAGALAWGTRGADAQRSLARRGAGQTTTSAGGAVSVIGRTEVIHPKVVIEELSRTSTGSAVAARRPGSGRRYMPLQGFDPVAEMGKRYANLMQDRALAVKSRRNSSGSGPRALDGGPRALIAASPPIIPANFDGPQAFDTFEWDFSQNPPTFSGIAFPPDNGLAVGPNHVVATVNTVMQVYDKTGTPLLRDSSGNPQVQGLDLGGLGEHSATCAQVGPTTILCFFNPSFWDAFAGTATAGEFTSDPRCIYDPIHDRFIVFIIDLQFTAPEHALLLMAVSATGDPTGQWIKFTMPWESVDPADGTTRTWGDQPTCGLSPTALYISGDFFQFGGGLASEELRVFNLADLEDPVLATQGAIRTTVFPNVTDAAGRAVINNGSTVLAMKPVVTYGQTPNGEEFVVSSERTVSTTGQVSGSSLGVMSINTNGIPVLTKRLLSVPRWTTPPDAVQGGSGIKVATNRDSRMINAVWRNGSIWCAHTVGSDDRTAAVARWYEITAPTISNIALRQSGTVVGTGNAYFPAICVNDSGQAVIGYTTSNPAVSPSAGCASRTAFDQLGTMQTAVIYKQGALAYVPRDITDASLLPIRWGDYSFAVADPDGNQIWLMNEYSRGPDLNGLNDTPIWGERIASAFPATNSISGVVTQPGNIPVPGVTVQVATANQDPSVTTLTTQPNAGIPDNRTSGLISSQNMQEDGVLTDVKVTVNISHPNPTDLDIILIHPDGTTAQLRSRGDPSNPLATYTVPSLVGKPTKGQWRLWVRDLGIGATGTLNSWSLTLTFIRVLTRATTDQFGAYSVTGLPHGTYTLTPSRLGFTFIPPNATVTLPPSQVVNFTAIGVQRNLVQFTLNPTTVSGGSPSSGTVVLDGPAPAPGVTVDLFSEDLAANPPPTVTVPTGQTSATFQIPTAVVLNETIARIHANLNGIDLTQDLRILAPGQGLNLTLQIRPTSVAGGDQATGTVALNMPAPFGGVTVRLSSSNAAASVPTSIAIAGGQTGASFAIQTRGVSALTVAKVTATLPNGAQANAQLTIVPAIQFSFSVFPGSLRGGNSAQGRISLALPAPSAGYTINLSTNAPNAVLLPPSVTVPGGLRVLTFNIPTARVTARVTASITAKSGNVTRTASLVVNP